METVTVKVMRDECQESPREWGNLGTMACWHRNYELGDIQPTEDPEEWLANNAPAGGVVLPLYLYDHSGISMSVGGDSYPYNCPFDGGQVGYIVCTRERILKEYSVKRITKKLREMVIKILQQEVKTYDQYLQGDIWGYVIEKSHDCTECKQKVIHTDEVDSCWGFYDFDSMKDHVDPQYHELLECAWNNR